MTCAPSLRHEKQFDAVQSTAHDFCMVISPTGELKAVTPRILGLLNRLPLGSSLTIPSPGGVARPIECDGKRYQVAAFEYSARSSLPLTHALWLTDEGALRSARARLALPAPLQRTTAIFLWQIGDTSKLVRYYFRLSPRLQEVLDLVLCGRNNKEIGRLMDIQEQTVKGYVRKICTDLSVRNRETLFASVLSEYGFQPWHWPSADVRPCRLNQRQSREDLSA